MESQARERDGMDESMEDEADIIHLQSLALPCAVYIPSPWIHLHRDTSSATEAWKKLHSQAQPATVSVTLTLNLPGFASAARKDALDTSTMHYGHLAKRIRSEFEVTAAQKQDLCALWTAFDLVKKCVDDLNHMEEPIDRRPVRRQKIEFCLPKAGMFTREVKVGWERDEGSGKSDRRWMEFWDVQMAVLIGVNEYERAGKQPLLGAVRCEWFTEHNLHAVLNGLFGVEAVLMDIVQSTEFETLESLISYAVEELQRRLLKDHIPGGRVKLRLAKPSAVVFADAPAVEVTRRVQV